MQTGQGAIHKSFHFLRFLTFDTSSEIDLKKFTFEMVKTLLGLLKSTYSTAFFARTLNLTLVSNACFEDFFQSFLKVHTKPLFQRSVSDLNKVQTKKSELNTYLHRALSQRKGIVSILSDTESIII